MKKTLLFISAILLASTINAQQQLQNPGFEDWDDVGTSTQEPTNWSSLKTADALASLTPEVLSRVTGRTGDWAVELEVKSVLGIKANGLMTNGRVHASMLPSEGYVYTNSDDSKWNTPFTDRPDSIVGWYKHDPQSGDRSKIEIILHTGTVGRLPMNATTITNKVGRARFDFTSSETEWTRFAKEFNYSSSVDPEYVLVTISAGDSTIAKEGTKLWIDDLELIYNSVEPGDTTNPGDTTGPSVGLQDHQIYDMAINGSKGYLYFGVEEDHEVFYSVADVTGKIVQQGRAQATLPFRHDNGIYFIHVKTAKESFTKKLYISQ